jgi:hypothetical protein
MSRSLGIKGIKEAKKEAKEGARMLPMLQRLIALSSRLFYQFSN